MRKYSQLTQPVFLIHGSESGIKIPVCIIIKADVSLFPSDLTIPLYLTNYHHTTDPTDTPKWREGKTETP